jgi:hypothetical protein
MAANPVAAAEAWPAHVVRNRLAEEANRVVNELERAASHARALLDDPRMNHPGLSGMRARLLSGLVAVGAVALGREEG